MEEKFDLIQKQIDEKIEELRHKLDTVYTPSKRPKRELRTVEATDETVANPLSKNEELKLRHKMQEESLKHGEEN